MSSPIRYNPITPTRHPADLLVVTEAHCSLLQSFNVAAKTLRRDNRDILGVLWLPTPDPALEATIAQRAAAYDAEYFGSTESFDRRRILDHLRDDPDLLFTLEDIEMDEEGNLLRDEPNDPSDFQSYYSTTSEDGTGNNADTPHVDGIREGVILPHSIRAIRNNLGIGTILYEGALKRSDIGLDGRAHRPTSSELHGRLGAAWQVVTPRSVLFLNNGGPLALQKPHMAPRTPVSAQPVPFFDQSYTRQIDNFDFRARV